MISSKATAPRVPMESPVPGVRITLASLLVEAIKTRRKYFSKSSSLHNANESLIKNIENRAIDATTAFINELRNQATETSSSLPSKLLTNSPINCLKFLLEIMSTDSNSFHLRRSSVALIREILQRSSDARAYVANGDTLLQFVSIVEGVDDNGEGCDEAASASASGRGADVASSIASLFQQEAVELIHQLAMDYGQLYPKFTVASRLLGDAHMQLHIIGTTITDDGSRGSRNNNNQRYNMSLIRKKRDEALERGPKACRSLDHMIGRAEICFKVLIPRWGGFNTNNIDNDANEKLEGREQNYLAASDHNPISYEASVDLEDDDLIEWEEGDDGLLSDNGEDDSSSNGLDPQSHVDAVAQTLAVMERSGTLLDGRLSIGLGESAPKGSAQTKSETEGTREYAVKADARHELEIIVKKLSSKFIKRLNQWINALTYADGMLERAVVDPARFSVGEVGPVSLVLLPKEKRNLRGALLGQMLKLKGELEGVLRSADVLGVTHSESGEGNEREDHVQTPAAAPIRNNAGVANRKRPWLSRSFTQGYQTAKKQRQTKKAKVRVIYRGNSKV